MAANISSHFMAGVGRASGPGAPNRGLISRAATLRLRRHPLQRLACLQPGGFGDFQLALHLTPALAELPH